MRKRTKECVCFCGGEWRRVCGGDGTCQRLKTAQRIQVNVRHVEVEYRLVELQIEESKREKARERKQETERERERKKTEQARGQRDRHKERVIFQTPQPRSTVQRK